MKNSILIILVLLFGFQSHATHMMGSDITYECIGPGKYKAKLVVYRDCTGVNLGGITATIRCGTNSQQISAKKTGISDISPFCGSVKSACFTQSRTGIGVEEHSYEVLIDLNKAPYKTWKSNGCCNFVISWSQCCRNNEINTINIGNFYSEATINICNLEQTSDSCNNSPIVTNKPIIFACCNEAYISNMGAIDNRDFDSLSFEMVSPLSGPGTKLAHISPYSARYPMTPKCPNQINCKPDPNAIPPIGFYFNETNGDIVFTPSKCDEVGVLVVKVTEWRKSKGGKMLPIGTINRDIQINVQNCGSTNRTPQILADSFTYCVTEGDTLSFNIEAKDSMVGKKQQDTVSMAWNHGIDSATFKIKDPKSREKEATFTWITKVGDATTSNYYFTVTTEDNNCPIQAKAIRSFTIKVLPKNNNTSITDKRAQKLKVYPSPSRGIVNIEIPQDTRKGIIEVWSLDGKLMHQESIETNSIKATLNLVGKAQGVYLVLLKSEKNYYYSRVLIE